MVICTFVCRLVRLSENAKSSAFFSRELRFEVLLQAKHEHPFVRTGTDIGVEIGNFGSSDVADDLIQKRLGFFDQCCAHLLHQFTAIAALG